VPLNRMSLGFTIGDLPEFSGPGDLADCVIALRKHEREQLTACTGAPISDEGIRRLIDLAYHTSMVSEEGRFPRFRVVSHGTNDLRTIAECNVTLDSVDRLRRLAPCVSCDHGVALLVRDDAGPLRCVGLAIVDDMGFSVMPGRPEIVPVGTPALGFRLRVEGPGQLRCSSAGDSLGVVRLVGSRIHQVVPYSCVPGVRTLLNNLSERLLDRLIATKGEDARKWFGHGIYQFLDRVLAHSLEHATDLGHGGAFVVLPTAEGNVDAFDIQCQFPASLSLGRSISDFWCACVDWAETKGEENRESALHHWRWRRERVFASAAAIAGLSAVDGCVVLTRNLDLLGFGGVIGLGECDAKVIGSPRKLKNAQTGAVYEDSEIASLGLGTRHRSAFRFCKVHPNAFVFVISQDGDLRVLFSDDEFVYGFEHLYAWANESDVV
jgi:hypothetical protein